MLGTLRKLIGWFFLHDQGLVMRRASTLPSDLIVVSFMIMVIGDVLRDEDDTDRESDWESSSK